MINPLMPLLSLKFYGSGIDLLSYTITVILQHISHDHRKIDDKEGPVPKMEAALGLEAKILSVCFSFATP